MTTLYQYSSRYTDDSDTFDSSVSIGVAFVVFILIITLGFMYGLSDIRQKNTNESLEGTRTTVNTISSPSPQATFPEPGSLAY